MYIAMNRFRINKGHEGDFEQVWLTRETQLKTVPGFQSFVLLKRPERDDHTLCASHTTWEDSAAFEAWTHSEPKSVCFRTLYSFDFPEVT